MNPTIVASGIAIDTSHEFYNIVLQNWTSWSSLHTREHKRFDTHINITASVMNDGVINKCLFIWTTDKVNACGTDFWQGVWDDVASYCRAYIDGLNHRQQSVSVQPIGVESPVDFSLSRKGPEIGSKEDFLLSNLSIATQHIAITIIDLPPAELKKLGKFILEYSDEAESDEAENKYDLGI